MGIDNGGKVLHSLSGISLQDLHDIGKRLVEERGVDRPPTVVIDANWAGRSNNPDGSVPKLMEVVERCRSSRFRVEIAIDPRYRHHSKVASIERAGQRENARAKAYQGKTELMHIASQLQSADLPEHEHLALEAQQTDLQKMVRTAENKSSDGMLPPDFLEQVREEVEKITDGSVRLSVGVWQADATITYLVEHGEADIIFANDADFSFALGPKALQVVEFKLKNSTIDDMKLKTGFSSMVEMVQESVSADVVVEAAKFPLIDGKDDCRYRFAVGVAMGSDVLVKGIVGLGVKTLADLIGETDGADADCDILLEALVKLPKCLLSVEELNVLLDACQFEPAFDRQENGKLCYTFAPPPDKIFDSYLEGLAPEDASVASRSDGIALSECHGHNGQAPHPFLTALGVTCQECQELCCGFCCEGFTPCKNASKDAKWTCLKCFASEIPAEETEAEMRQAIRAAGLELPREASFVQVQEFYNIMIVERTLDIDDEHSQPTLMSRQLNDGTLETACGFNFCDGGLMVLDEALSVSDLIALVGILAENVTFSEKYVTADMTEANRRATKNLSNAVNRMMVECRVDSAQRLKNRTLRHSQSRKQPALDSGGKGAVFHHDGCIGLKISHEVQPSYRADSYKVTTAFTRDTLLAAECSCDAGPHDDGRHVCVHVFPLLAMLTLLLFDGLAEHVLFNLSERLNAAMENELSAAERTAAMNDIRMLIASSGTPMKEEERSKLPGCETIVDLLSAFAVGTEKGKMRRRPPPPVEQLKPLWKYKLINPTTRMRYRIERAQRPAEEEVSDEAEEEYSRFEPAMALLPPDYRKIQIFGNSLRRLLKRTDSSETADFVGHKLIDHRAGENQGFVLPDDLETVLLEPARTRERQIRTRPKRHSELVVTGCGADSSSEEGDSERLPPLAQTQGPRSCKRQCCMLQRQCTGQDGPFRRIPCPPSPVKPKDPPNRRVRKAKAIFRRDEMLRRATIPKGHRIRHGNDLRICGRHVMVKVRKSFPYIDSWDDENRPILKSKTATFLVQDNNGPAMSPSSANKGLAADRFQTRYLSSVERNSWEAATQQTVELSDESSPDPSQLNECVKHAIGFDVHDESRRTEEDETKTKLDPPVVEPDNISDADVKMRTGFASLLLMLLFIAVVCNGCVAEMTAKETNLTWFEEWFLYFEWLWGRENVTLVSLGRKFKTTRFTATRIIEAKLKKVSEALRRWPRFVSLDEDWDLRSQKWRNKYDKSKRPIMWDNTNIKAPNPADADINAAWYSHYYGGCVAKGAVFLQLCGWMGCWDLWAGSISDTDYQTAAGVLEFQNAFVQMCASAMIAFLNIMDKGYRCVLAAWKAGRQLCQQPAYARSDRRFNSNEVTRSAAVASNRSGNERHVNVAKRPNLIKRGLEKHQDPATIAAAWKAWGFQANFMYKPVL